MKLNRDNLIASGYIECGKDKSNCEYEFCLSKGSSSRMYINSFSKRVGGVFVHIDLNKSILSRYVYRIVYVVDGEEKYYVTTKDSTIGAIEAIANIAKL